MNDYIRCSMKQILFVALILLLLSAGFATAAVQKAEKNASEPTEPLKIVDLLNTPEKYSDQNLSFTGKITSQCGSGCWFILSDESGDLYVNLKPNNFVIPPAMGKTVVVNGTALLKDGDIILLAKGVTLEGKTYP